MVVLLVGRGINEGGFGFGLMDSFLLGKQSIPQTRLRFMKQMIGVEEGSEDEEGEGEVVAGGEKSGKGKEREKEDGDRGLGRRGARDHDAEAAME